MFVVITMKKAKIINVELYAVDCADSYEAMLQGVKEIQSQGYRCEFHKAM